MDAWSPPRRKPAARRLALASAVALLLALAAGPAVAAADPVIMAAGDIACSQPGSASPGKCSQVYTSNLALQQQLSPEGLAAVLAIGDEQYDAGTLGNFNAYYDPSWGRLNSVVKPAPGNHEYKVSGAAGYFDYFASKGVQTGGRNGWYSFNIGTWHLVSLNSSNQCTPVSCASGSAQETWLRNDLALNQQPCVLAYWHHPLGSAAKEQDMWQDFYTAGVDFVLTGHIHHYTAPHPINPYGNPDPNGPREAVIGTGGDDANGSGLLKMTLHANSADWQFVGSGASDSGSATCHNGSPGPVTQPQPAPKPPTADFEGTQDPSTLAVAFEDISTAIPQVTSWQWSFGDGTTSTQQAPLHTYAKAGTYKVSLTVTNTGGPATKTADVVVTAPIPKNPPVVVGPTTTDPPTGGGGAGGGTTTTTTTATTATTPAPAPDPSTPGTTTTQNSVNAFAAVRGLGRLTLGSLVKGFPVTVTGPSGRTLTVALTVPASVAKRAHLHQRRLVKVTLTKPGVASLRLGPKTRAALRRSKGKLTAVLAVTGTGVTPYTKTLTLHR
ncbi:MAG: hypothetical protein QOH43_3887 [Solirubrobacteraceae bacterium]|jgi:PKD repeat protein|nr:hypothetical protein [Solirubrobacteraceae bacterium]